MIANENSIYLGKSPEGEQYLNLKYANRHGLIAGATGTGKTVSLQDMAEGFSAAGVPVFIADIKGDLGGLSQMGGPNPPFDNRAREIGFELNHSAFPVVFWDIFGKKGHPIRTTVSEMGPLLLSRLLDLNPTQEGVLNIAFVVADEEGLLLLDYDDLRAILSHVEAHKADYSVEYGNISTASVGAIQRSLLTLEQQGGKLLFGEPALEITDFMRLAPNGMGAVNILAADQLMQSPKIYSTFMLWLLSELFEDLPEVGDMDKPKLVFFFDEAHLLFDEAPKALVDKIEQLVKLIRSKGVGVYFITQNPQDIPEAVLAQLGNRIQHALRAYTPKEQKAVRVAAESFRVNPEFDTEEAITQLGIGEALVSTLQKKGVPSVVQKTLMRPPVSKVGTIDDAARAQVLAQSPSAGVYDTIVDRESAHEILIERVEQRPAAEAAPAASAGGMWGNVTRTVAVMTGTGDVGVATAQTHTSSRRSYPKTAAKQSGGRKSDSMLTTITKSVVRSVGSSVGRQIARGILKSMLK